MKFSCDKCGRVYVADPRVEGRTFKMRCKQCGHVILVRGKASAEAEQKPREEVVGTFSVGASPGSEPVPPASVEQTAPDPVHDLTADLGSVAEVRTPTPLPVGLVAAAEPSPEPAPEPAYEPISPDDPFAPRPDGFGPEASDPFSGPGPGGYIDLKLDEDEKTPSVGVPIAPPPAAVAGPAKTPAPQPAKTPPPRAVPPASAAAPARKKGGAGKVVGVLAAVGMVGAGAFAVLGGGSTPSSKSPESASPARPQSDPTPIAAPAAAPVAPKPTPAPEPAVAAPQPEPAAEVLPRKVAAPEPAPAAPPPSKTATRAAKPAQAESKPAAAKRAPPAPARQVAAAPAPPPLPDTIGPRPDQAAVTRALARSQRAIDACVAATLARDPSFDLPATAVVIATVNPAGKIVYPTLDDAPLNVSDLGACIKGVVSRTPVQKFEGDVVRVRVPVQLRR